MNCKMADATVNAEIDRSKHPQQVESVMVDDSPFSSVEQFVLSALLLEPEDDNGGGGSGEDDDTHDDNGDKSENRSGPLISHRRVLDPDILFSTASCVQRANAESSLTALTGSIKAPAEQPTQRPPSATATTTTRPNRRFQAGLWHAHEDGVTPRQLSKMASVLSAASRQSERDSVTSTPTRMSSFASDVEVRGRRGGTGSNDGGNDGDDDDYSIESQDESDQCFDAWQVLKDEYAKDFGFDYTPGTHALNFDDDDSDDDGDSDDVDDDDGRSDEVYSNLDAEKQRRHKHNTFKIIGTSINDTSAHPHVLSPPLMDRLLSHMPKHLRKGQNFWMRYSLIRDGASLYTLSSYARAMKDSILAIETTHGQVFGVYTSNTWKAQPSAFGGPPSFIWRMRSSRMTKVHSLFDQAEIESQIDVWDADESSVSRLQMLTNHRIGVGIGNMNRFNDVGEIVESEMAEEKKKGKNYGFAIALEDDLLRGTSSRSPSYQNPCLVDDSSNGEAFETMNVELWTLTPAFTEDTAQKIEMTQHFITESIRSSSSSTRRGDDAATGKSSRFSSRDLNQAKFFRQVGKNDEHEQLRSQWS